MIHVFIVGSKGIPAKYGGFETFVEQLTAGKKSESIKYHVSCMDNNEQSFMHNNADCFGVKVPINGAAGRIVHVGFVLNRVEKWCRKNPSEQVIVYILGCRIGPLLIPHSHRLHKLGAIVCCNPDGLEWKRDKWNAFEKRFLKYCESCLVRYSDLAICDSVNIEKYINRKYPGIPTTYIAYGAEISESVVEEDQINEWYKKHNILPGRYFLIVGRFVPENNYETMIREFMRSKTKKDLVIVTNVEQNKFFYDLMKKTAFNEDPRIKFVGTVYNQEMLKKIREQAFAYIHGHEVGGTNPSLLEALASTKLNLLLEVGFNREVGNDAVMYWSKDIGSLSDLINEVDILDSFEIEKMGNAAKKIIALNYNWPDIVSRYEKAFLKM